MQSDTNEGKRSTVNLIPISKPIEEEKNSSPEFPNENIDLDLNNSDLQMPEFSPIGRLGSSILSRSATNSSFARGAGGRSPLKKRSFDKPT